MSNTPEQSRAASPTFITPSIGSIDGAIESISSYLFRPEEEALQEDPPELREQQEEEELFYLSMTEGKSKTVLPGLPTGAWPYAPKDNPDPISINKAKKLLTAAFANVPCELPETGIHGHAWMIEDEKQWLKRDETEVVTAPKKPKRPKGKLTITEIRTYDDELKDHTLYGDLVRLGKAKLIEWFGDSVFRDLYVDQMLPIKVTPRDMFEHIAKTYANPRDNRAHMEKVQAEFQTPYDKKRPVEEYFKNLQDARDNAALLGQPYSDLQIMNRALREFDRQFPDDAYKSEKTWNEKDETERTWSAFKDYWKNEIHQWASKIKAPSKRANQAIVDTKLQDRYDELSTKMSTLEHQNNALVANALVARQSQHQQAFLADQRPSLSNDEISILTDLVASRVGLNASIPYTAPSPTIGGNNYNNSNASRYGDPQGTGPDRWKLKNKGRGLKFDKYCWSCGCNCTHYTRSCRDLSKEDRARYEDATCSNTMGGSTKYIERRNKYQKEFGFDGI